MYLRAEPDRGLGRAAPDRRVIDYQCSTNAVLVDDFAVGGYRIPLSRFDKLQKLVDDAEPHLKAGTPFSLALTGHTDKSGEERMNRGLSLARAVEVQEWLKGAGLPVHSVVGKGETSPLDPANTAAAFRRNRRVEIRVCLPKGTPTPTGLRPGLGGFSSLHDQFLQCEPDIVFIDGFNVGDYRLLPRHYEKLMKLLDKARNSKAAGLTVTLGLTGHTDNSGAERMNTGLSLMRAHEVQTFFTRQGVAVHDASGEGELKPRRPNTSPTNRALNRRVEILVCVPS